MTRRFALPAVAVVAVLGLTFGCGGDDDGDATATAFIQPSPHTTEEALAELDQIIDLVQNPDGDLVDTAGIGEFELQTRITHVMDGTAQVTGLTGVRQTLSGGDGVLTREYLHNTITEILEVPFTNADTTTISASAMEGFDPLQSFAPRGENYEVSGIFRDAVIRAIQLWYLI